MGLWRELVASGKGVFANWAGRGWPRAETRGHRRLREEKQKQKQKPKPKPLGFTRKALPGLEFIDKKLFSIQVPN